MEIHIKCHRTGRRLGHGGYSSARDVFVLIYEALSDLNCDEYTSAAISDITGVSMGCGREGGGAASSCSANPISMERQSNELPCLSLLVQYLSV